MACSAERISDMFISAFRCRHQCQIFVLTAGYCILIGKFETVAALRLRVRQTHVKVVAGWRCLYFSKLIKINQLQICRIFQVIRTRRYVVSLMILSKGKFDWHTCSLRYRNVGRYVEFRLSFQ